MMKPFIAITSQYNNEKMDIHSRYFKIITLCGGIAVPLPQSDDITDIRMYAERFDGFLFSGGDDVNPILYGEKKLPKCGFISDERDRFEILLLNEVMKLNKPVFAICRGIQLVNVALGGSLYQHIDGHNKIQHDVIIDTESPLFELYQSDRISVNSYHHQAVKEVSSLLKIAASAEGGTIEALYMPNLTAVQWHPEMMNDTVLLTDFVNKCNRLRNNFDIK